MKLLDNPFAVLGVSPRDDRRKVTEKADEAALLGGASVEDALGTLMKMNQRIRAELRWFPGCDPAVAETFLRYAKDLSDGDSTPMPSMDGLSCPLAQANALEAFFEVWPASDPEYIVGLCRSMDRILSRVTVVETKNMINGDRRAGGWDRIQDESAVADQLEARLRELARTVSEKMSRLPSEQAVRDTLGRIMKSDLDKQGIIAQAAADSYLFRIHDQEENLRTRLQGELSVQMKLKDKITRNVFDSLKPQVENWCRMTEPLRQTPGPMRNHAESICHDMRECIVACFNNAPTTTEKKSGIYPVAGGTQTRTITYESKKTACKQTIESSKWLASLFPEQVRFVEMLKADQDKLAEIIVEEDRVISEKLALGR